MSKELLVLSPVNPEENRPTKILDKNLNKLESFDSGFMFNFEIIEYKNFHKAMEIVFRNQDWFLVLGQLTEYGLQLYNDNEPGPRRKKKGKPTIQDKDGTEIVLDLDDHIIEGFDPTDPEPAIKKWLKERDIDCHVTWQITSGQKLKTHEARIRLYFELDSPASLQLRKAWAQSPEIMADGSVFTCSQPIYTAPPIIKGGSDPIKRRHGYIKGSCDKFTLPKEIIAKEKEYIGSIRGGLEFDFSSTKLPKDVLEGKIYRRYFMPLAFHYANLLGADRDAIFEIIAARAKQVKSREFDPDNAYQYIDDAIEKIHGEQVEEDKQNEVFTKSDFGEIIFEGVPEFPKDIMSKWPDPWPMLWENFKRVPREMTEPLLVPTILSLNGFMLRANFVTGMNRRPNMFFLNLTPSTGNKDVNSKNVIEDLDLIFRRMGQLKVTPFTGLINGESSITADLSFLQSFDEEENLFWVNTEATRIFHQLNQAGGNNNVAALGDKLIEVVDGRSIGGKKKVGQSTEGIKDPNAQILFYAQPETIERYITTETVDSGLFGRTMLSIIPDLQFDESNFSIFLHEGINDKEVDEDFYLFYMSNAMLFSKTMDKTVLTPTKKDMQLLHEWSVKFLFPLMKEDEALMKVLKRMGIAAEQLYCIVLGMCRAYDEYLEREPRETIDIRCLLPLLEYWTKTKIYAIKHFVNSSLDPLAEEVYKVITECVKGECNKMFRSADLAILKEKSLVNISVLCQILRNRKALIRRLEASNEKKNAISAALRLVEMMVRNGILIQKENGSKKYIGIAK